MSITSILLRQQVASPSIGTFRGDCEQRGDAERDASGDGFDVQPEGDPGDDYDQNCRQVGLDHVIAECALQQEVCFQATVFT